MGQHPGRSDSVAAMNPDQYSALFVFLVFAFLAIVVLGVLL